MLPKFKQKPLTPSDRNATNVKPSRLDPQTRDWIKKLLNSGKECLEVVKITGANKNRVYDIYNEITAGIKRHQKRNGTEAYKPRPVVTKCSGEKWCQCVTCAAEAHKTRELSASSLANDIGRIETTGG